MRVAVLTGLFACALIFSFGSSSASAQASKSTDPQIETTKTEKESDAPNVIDLLKNEPIVALRVISDDEDTSQNEEDEVDTKVHVVTENETLTIIAKQNDVSWKRLFDKNNQIKDPDYLEVGMEITIPEEDEELESRALPEKPVAIAKVATRTHKGSSDGNLYTAGNCTWYVKSRRPDLPNNLGNAATWVSRAASQGLPTGSTPQVGAVGQKGNHVVYIESVNTDGTVTFSEMNYKGLYSQTTRTLPASSFSYIY